MFLDRHRLHKELTVTERDLTAVQAIVLLLLSIIIGYAAWLLYIRDLHGLIGLLPPATASCAALLVAKTATRLLIHNMFVRADDRVSEIVRVTHHTLALLNDLRGRVHYMGTMLSEGNRPVVALTKNAEYIQKRYEALFDREIYDHLPGPVIDRIIGLSGSVFGLSVLAAELASTLGRKGYVPSPNNTNDRVKLVQSTSKLGSELDDLFTAVSSLRTQVE